jgi:hypothetical protein
VSLLGKSLTSIILAMGVLALSACGRAAGSADVPPHVVVLDGTDQPLRDDFNRDRGAVRLVFLVDPICPDCLRGLADMGDDVVAKLPKGARVKIYIVHEPVIGGRAKDIPAAAGLLHTTLARNYWNPTGDFGNEMSHALGYWDGWRWVYAWDTWLIYAPNATWTGKIPPQPAFLMHQLGGLEGNPKFQRLDSKVFAGKLDMMLAATNQKAVTQ